MFDSGEDWALIRADLTACYPEQAGLDRFQRQVVYLKPRTILLCDRLVTRDGDKRYIRRYEWLLHTDPGVARWQAAGDSLAAVLKDTGEPILKGKVFPSTRYFFERQSMDFPNGTPKTRALSLTMIGRLPAEVEIAAILSVSEKGRKNCLDYRSECWRNDSGTYLYLPEAGKNAPWLVIFAAGDTVKMKTEHVLTTYYKSLLVTGLKPSGRYGFVQRGKGFILAPDETGDLLTSESGSLFIVKKEGIKGK